MGFASKIFKLILVLSAIIVLFFLGLFIQFSYVKQAESSTYIFVAAIIVIYALMWKTKLDRKTIEAEYKLKTAHTETAIFTIIAIIQGFLTNFQEVTILIWTMPWLAFFITGVFSIMIQSYTFPINIVGFKDIIKVLKE
ncbi:MAG TPA: hypothetical protein VFF13_05685 [archaeon]|nr:hypothetical protein [archaeon]